VICRAATGQPMARAALVGLAITLAPHSALAFDPFEIQVYEPEVHTGGESSLELHSNYVARGLTSADPPELSSNHVLHETLEAAVGLGRGFELGGYLQSALRPDASYDYAGVKTRLKYRLPVPARFPLAFAVNTELSFVPERYDPAVWALEVRPVAEWRPGHVVVGLNPIVGTDLAGPRPGSVELSPCARVRYDIAGLVGVGVEYYWSTGALASSIPYLEQGHHVFETVDLLASETWELHVGVGEGLGRGSHPLVLSLVVGRTF
jgi:hypothetical protein